MLAVECKRHWSGNNHISDRRPERRRTSVTVTITAMCGADSTAQTGSFIMCADTLVTWCVNGVPASSNQLGTKIYDLPHGFYVAIAGDISQSHQVVSNLYHQMESFQADDPRLVDLTKLALDRTAEYVRLWIRREVLAEYSVSLEEFLNGRIRNRTAIAKEIRERVISTELTIAGFNAKGSPILLYTDCINIQEQTNPGFFVAGAGQCAALDWLNFRGQNCFMSVQRTFYHVREAKQFSEICPVVGGLNQTILLRKHKPIVNLSEVKPSIGKWFEGLFPRKTDWLENQEAWEMIAEDYGIQS